MSGPLSAQATALALGCVVITFAAPIRNRAQTQSPVARVETRTAIREVSSAIVAQQLGARLSPSQPGELTVGASLTGSLSDPERLALLGIAEARPGARVTMVRVAEQRLVVEVDEIEPVLRTRRVTLRLQGDGQLSVMAR